MAKQSDKWYHDNGLCYLFSCVHENMLKGKPGRIENKDVQYPTREEVEMEEVFSMFTKLQIPGEVINLDDNKDKGDNDDDAPGSKETPRNDNS
ncbi:hypothetical protein GOP47_0008052 [Adiantum capillus-veneris]|uniref:Uncharacterized protein n=1 Tax=Adiantum capillus-veneris TaxID=13818 RepID=A0A9D4UYY5_ADICA|nr:hypothetical protein GOP47_0008052 [Adiantum capillus-veneris]